MANKISVNVSDNQVKLPVTVSTKSAQRSVQEEQFDPFYVGAEAKVEQLDDGALITCKDKSGTTTARIYDGEDGQDGKDGVDGKDGKDGVDGQDGADGFSPIANVSKSGDTATITITDANGTTTTTITDGADGTDGQDGTDGEDGVSPTITSEAITGGHRLTITDAEGTTTVDVMDGADGQDGTDGHTPEITATKIADTTTVYVDGVAIATIVDGEDGVDGQDGADGADGADGYSPVASVSKVGDTATITITDLGGTTTATISDGQDGQDGQDGADGQDGYSPSATVSKVGNATTITITDKDGTTSEVVYDGQTNVQSDWNEADSTADDFIKNKPTIPTHTSNLVNDSGFITSSGLLDLFYPIGFYIETSDTSFDPNVSWGGTWVKDSEGKVTVSQDTSDADFATVGSTGGRKDSIVPYHKHEVSAVSNAITGGAHNHTASNGANPVFNEANTNLGAVMSFAAGNYKRYSGALSSPTHTHNLPAHDTDYAGTSGAETNSNLQPFVVIIRWHRVA